MISKMRPAHLYSLAVPALLGAGIGLILVAGHKDKPAPVKAEAAVTAGRRLHVEAYQAAIPKAPVTGKLETMNVGPAGDLVGTDQLAEAAPPPVVRAAPKPPTLQAQSTPAPPASVQPRAYVRAETPRPPAAQRGYAQADTETYEPRGYRQPQMYWAADPRARRGAYVDPAPQYDVYGVAPPRAQDAESSSEFGFRITVPVCRRAAQQGDPLGDTPQCREMLGAVREQQRLCQQAWEDGDDRVVMSAACRQAARLR